MITYNDNGTPNCPGFRATVFAHLIVGRKTLHDELAGPDRQLRPPRSRLRGSEVIPPGAIRGQQQPICHLSQGRI